MTQRSAFVIQVLEKIGAPLMAAVLAHDGEKTEDGKKEAERVAALIGKAVQVSIGLANTMELKDTEQADAIRLAIAAMAGPLIAGHYRQTGKIPGDNDIKRITASLEAVLTFSDSFAPAADNTMRLENIEAGMAPADENQIHIQYMNALVPVVNAVASYSFGRPEEQLAQEVADRLVKRAGTMREKLLNGATDPKETKQAELQLLSALAMVYVECHKRETSRIMVLDDQARAAEAEAAGGTMKMDTVWDAFEKRAVLTEALGAGASPSSRASSAAGSQAPAPAAPPEQPQAVTPAAPPPLAEQPAAPAQAAQEQPAEQSGDYNPMSFFKPIKQEGGESNEGGGEDTGGDDDG
jgi:hypothetical protein